MKEYKLVYLNKGLKLSVEKDISQAEKLLNDYIAQGWTLEQIVPQDAGIGILIGVFSKEIPGT